MSDYLQGATIWPTADFTDIAGNPVDPVVVVVVRDPDGTVTMPVASSTVVGTWTFELDLDEVGIYRWEFHGLTSEGNVPPCQDEACVLPSLMAAVS